IARTLGVSRAGYGEVDTRAETITIARDWNAPGVNTLAGVLQFRDYGSYIDDLKRGETVIVEDARTDSRTAETAAQLEGISARAFVNMPLTEHGGLVALL
ncbi:GAF domain-containing protein, partial [Klebsiella pneumoniae]|nr:GAF domain-containing protein [Klebsiella pneumoniae]